jgi:CDP-diacylglycerol---serine O-phosphatidyltransferase
LNARRKRFSMIREFHFADWFTLGNAACGTAAVMASMAALQTADNGRLIAASLLIFAALVFDVLDGRVARWRQKASPLGRELDSLADVISFGVAPAALGYACGLQGVFDQIILVFFVACGVSRLARFNITAEELSASTGKVAYFEGTPIPTSALLVALLAVAAWAGAVGDRLWFGSIELAGGTLHPLSLLYALSGSLMISRMRIPKL